MNRKASPMALEPVAQAVATAVFGPCRPNRIETLPLAALTISLGTVNGLTRATPRSIRICVLLLERLDAADAASR